MSDDDYDKAYDAGRSGQGFPGGDSIAYAGYLAGAKARESAGPYADGGGGGPVNFQGRVVITALDLALKRFGRVLRFLLPAVIGFIVGAVIGVVASDRMNTPREPTMIRFGLAGAATLLMVWILRRLIARKRSAKRRPFPTR